MQNRISLLAFKVLINKKHDHCHPVQNLQSSVNCEQTPPSVEASKITVKFKSYSKGTLVPFLSHRGNYRCGKVISVSLGFSVLF